MKTQKSFFLFSAICFSLIACHKDKHTNQIPVVQLPSNRSVQIKAQPLDTIHLSGTAVDNDGTIASYLWSQVSGPNSSAIANPGSSSSDVSGLVSGEYVFQLSATDNEGATGTKSITITVMAPQSYTVTLSPANNPDESLIAGNSSSDYTSPHFTEIDAATWTISSVPVSLRGSFKFDMSSIPAGATIASAKLSLFSNPTPLNGNLVNANYGTSNAMYIKRITSDWNAITTTWFTQPSTEITDQIVVPQTSAPTLDLTDLDVTSMVGKMYTDANYGFMLQLQNEVVYNSRIFCSSWYSDASKHPKLVIIYSKY